MSSRHLALAGLVALSGCAGVQPSPVAGRDSVMRGLVLNSQTKQPLADVVVTVTSPGVQDQGMAITDVRGEYVIRSLPAGPCCILIERDDFVRSKRQCVAGKGPAVPEVFELDPDPSAAGPVIDLREPGSVDPTSATQGLTLGHGFIDAIPLQR